MTGASKTTQTNSKNADLAECYSSESTLVDFILGITFEIWEQGQVEKIYDYYAEDVRVYSLEGMTSSAATMVKNTYDTLNSFPDRLLIADDVINCGTAKRGFSSHRLTSPMTNHGGTRFGPATGKQIQITNIADCEVNNGLITREWLIRDNLALVRQLGFDPVSSASILAEQFDDRQNAWLASEFSRTSAHKDSVPAKGLQEDPIRNFAEQTLSACWLTGDRGTLELNYAPYCVLHRSPIQKHSGRDQILQHYSGWRNAFPDASLSVDHVCTSPFDHGNQRISVRWSVAAIHQGRFADTGATGKPIYILGVTHWQLVDGRIAAEWTVFDELALLAQTLL